METSNSHIIEQALAAVHFINHDLMTATTRLADRRGETMDDVKLEGWSRIATTEEDGHDTNERIFFESSYDIDGDGAHDFMYKLNKTTEAQRDLKDCTVDELLGVYEALNDDDNEFVTNEQRQGLLQLVTAYVDGRLESDVEVVLSREMRLLCRADAATGSITIERTMILSVDDTVITATSVGNVDILEELPLPEDVDAIAPTDLMVLPPEAEHDIDMSTPTVDDIEELREMLQMLGLADRNNDRSMMNAD